MYSFLHSNIRLSVPHLIASYFLHASGRHSGSAICGGKFVTRLARYFGYLTRQTLPSLRQLEPAAQADEAYFVKAKLVHKDRGAYYLPACLRRAPPQQYEQQQHQPPEDPEQTVASPPQFHPFGPGPYPWDPRFDSIDQHFASMSLGYDQARQENIQSHQTTHDRLGSVYGMLQEQNTLLRQSISNVDHFGSVYNQQSRESGRYFDYMQSSMDHLFSYQSPEAQASRPPPPDPYQYFPYMTWEERQHQDHQHPPNP